MGTKMGPAPELELMTPGEVARVFRVDPKTVTRWANTGRLSTIRTLGGQRRYDRDEVQALRDASRVGRDEAAS